MASIAFLIVAPVVHGQDQDVTIDGALGAFSGSVSSWNGELDHTVDGTIGAFAGSAEVQNTVNSYRYWRLDFTDVVSDPLHITLLRHIGFYVSGVEITSKTLTPNATASSVYNHGPNDLLFFAATSALSPPNTPNSNYVGWASEENSMPAWWKLDFGSAVAPDQLRIAPQTVARAPSAFTISGSNDDVNYTVLESYSTPTGWTANTDRNFSITI